MERGSLGGKYVLTLVYVCFFKKKKVLRAFYRSAIEILIDNFIHFNTNLYIL